MSLEEPEHDSGQHEAEGCKGEVVLMPEDVLVRRMSVSHIFHLLISAWHGHLNVRDRCSPTTHRRGVLVSHVNYSFLDIDD